MAARKRAKPTGTHGTPKKGAAKKAAQPSDRKAQKAAQEKALRAFAIAGTVSGACRAAGVGRRTWYNWLATDPDFAGRVTELTDDVTDELEEEAIKRAKDSADTLLIFLLKHRRRAIYGDKLQVTVASPEVVARVREFYRIIAQELPGLIRQGGTAEEITARLGERLQPVWDGQ